MEFWEKSVQSIRINRGVVTNEGGISQWNNLMQKKKKKKFRKKYIEEVEMNLVEL